MNDFQLLTRNQLDTAAYDHCVASSPFAKIYALSWYLDAVTQNNWKALVWDNYRAVFPVPYGRSRKTYFQRRPMQPLFCQQLGFFSAESTLKWDKEKQAFFESLQPFVYCFHEGHMIAPEALQFKGKAQPNFVLDLSPCHKELFHRFSKNTKRNLKKADKANLSFQLSSRFEDISTYLDFFATENHYTKKKSLQKRLAKLLWASFQQNCFRLITARQDETLLGAAVLLEDGKRTYYLSATHNETGKKTGAAAFLINEWIKQNKHQHYLDFEGSKIKGVARFYQGFGAENRAYGIYS